mmetsp:Transcript_18660/g.65933  ORF Transcript_18660/g.65933 Transcript_18660/m.65933 type:complete len:1130 (-) Transcript_18660:47-3436(-)
MGVARPRQYEAKEVTDMEGNRIVGASALVMRSQRRGAGPIAMRRGPGERAASSAVATCRRRVLAVVLVSVLAHAAGVADATQVRDAGALEVHPAGGVATGGTVVVVSLRGGGDVTAATACVFGTTSVPAKHSAANHSMVSCTTPALSAGASCVTLTGVTASCAPFTVYAPPSLASISPAAAPAYLTAPARAAVRGSGFAALGTSANRDALCLWEGAIDNLRTASRATIVNDTDLSCDVTICSQCFPGAINYRPFRISLNGADVSKATLQYPRYFAPRFEVPVPPALPYVSPSAPARPAVFRLTAIDPVPQFGALGCRISGVVFHAVVETVDNQQVLVCTGPPPEPSLFARDVSHRIETTFDGQIWTAANAEVAFYYPPVVTSVTPTWGYSVSNTYVVVHGTNISAVPASPVVCLFGDVQGDFMGMPQGRSDAVYCRAPVLSSDPKAHAIVDVSVSLNGGFNRSQPSAGATFSYEAVGWTQPDCTPIGNVEPCSLNADVAGQNGAESYFSVQTGSCVQSSWAGPGACDCVAGWGGDSCADNQQSRLAGLSELPGNGNFTVYFPSPLSDRLFRAFWACVITGGSILGLLTACLLAPLPAGIRGVLRDRLARLDFRMTLVGPSDAPRMAAASAGKAKRTAERGAASATEAGGGLRRRGGGDDRASDRVVEAAVDDDELEEVLRRRRSAVGGYATAVVIYVWAVQSASLVQDALDPSLSPIVTDHAGAISTSTLGFNISLAFPCPAASHREWQHNCSTAILLEQLGAQEPSLMGPVCSGESPSNEHGTTCECVYATEPSGRVCELHIANDMLARGNLAAGGSGGGRGGRDGLVTGAGRLAYYLAFDAPSSGTGPAARPTPTNSSFFPAYVMLSASSLVHAQTDYRNAASSPTPITPDDLPGALYSYLRRAFTAAIISASSYTGTPAVSQPVLDVDPFDLDAVSRSRAAGAVYFGTLSWGSAPGVTEPWAQSRARNVTVTYDATYTTVKGTARADGSFSGLVFGDARIGSTPPPLPQDFPSGSASLIVNVAGSDTTITHLASMSTASLVIRVAALAGALIGGHFGLRAMLTGLVDCGERVLPWDIRSRNGRVRCRWTRCGGRSTTPSAHRAPLLRKSDNGSFEVETGEEVSGEA